MKDEDEKCKQHAPLPVLEEEAPAVDDGLLPPNEDADFLTPSDVVLEYALPISPPAVDGLMLVPVDARPFAVAVVVV